MWTLFFTCQIYMHHNLISSKICSLKPKLMEYIGLTVEVETLT